MERVTSDELALALGRGQRLLGIAEGQLRPGPFNSPIFVGREPA